MPRSRHLDRPTIEVNCIGGVPTPMQPTQSQDWEFQENEENLKFQAQVLSQVSDAIVAIDIGHRITYWNQAAEQLYGLKQTEVLGQSLEVAYHYCWIAETDRQAAYDSLATTGAWQGEVIHIKKTGEKLYIESSVSVLKNEHNCVIGLLAVSRNISDRKQMEAELIKSEERLRSYFTLPLVGIAVTSPEKGWLEVNDKLCDIFGYSRQELTQMTWTELTHPKDLAADLEHFSRVLAGKSEGYSMEKRFIRKDGQVIYAEISARCVRRADGSIDYFVALVQDITQRKQTEAELHRREQELQALVENTPDIIIRMDRNLRYAYINPAVERATGLPASAFIGKTSQEMDASPALSELWDTTLTKVFQTGQPEVIEFEDFSVNGLRTYQSRVVPEFDEQGVAKYALIVARDLTELKQAEAERTQLICEQAARAEAEAGQMRLDFLCQASEILASSLEYEKTLPRVADLAVPLMADWCLIDILDQSGGIRRLAIAHLDPLKQQLGWELSWRYPADVNAAVGIPQVLRMGVSQIAPEITDAALVAIACDGEHLEALRQMQLKSCAIAPLVANGRTLGAISLITAESNRRYTQSDLILIDDLARRIALAVENARLYRKSQAANRMKDEFLAVVSHELRTPLQSVLGWAQLLRHRRFDEMATVQALETIERNAKSQKKLIDEILDFSRMISGQIELKFRKVKLALIIYGALDLVRPSAIANNIELVPVLDSIAACVLGDRDRLQQVVFHLLSNAIKFTSSGGQVEIKLEQVKIENATSPLQKNNFSLNLPSETSILPSEQAAISYAKISVRDTGVGISPEFLPHVFDRFRQAESANTRIRGGLGLGLATVRQLLELHGGTVYAESQGEGQGATFTVLLPLLGESQGTSNGHYAVSSQ